MKKDCTTEKAREIARAFMGNTPQPDGREVYKVALAYLVGCYRETGIDLQLSELGRLLKEAEKDPVSYDVALEVSAAMIRKGESLPAVLASFAADVLTGKAKRPRQRGKHNMEYLWRDFSIYRAVYTVIKETGLNPTRNDVSSNISACDIVADELKMSYKAVQKIYYESIRRWPEIVP